MNPWLVVAVFSAGVVVGMIVAFLAALIYNLEDPGRPGLHKQPREE